MPIECLHIMGRRARIQNRKRSRLIMLVSLLAVTVIALIAFALLVNASLRTPYANYIYQPVPNSLYQQIAAVNDSTLSAVGSVAGVASPRQINGTALDLNGRPEVLYIGAEYCPYCAVERWALLIALSRFGTFSGLQYMLSSSNDVNANTPTFTFWNATYTSEYVSFVPVEEFNRTNEQTPWHLLNATEENVMSRYRTGGFPFVDLGNKYVVNGVQSSIDLSANDGYNWTKIITSLNDPNSAIAQQIDGAANKLVTTMCKIDGGFPASVCTQSYATISLSYTTAASGPAPASSLLLAPSVIPAGPMRGSNRWTG
jgi:hypothetical protein